ncbi:MAG: replication protein [Planctomycetia bacterium]|nr:MAG: replication protein [Planctomycetia bacterium]
MTVDDLPPVTPSGLTRQQWNLLFASDQIRQEPPDRLQFSHTVLCQIGIPRKHTPERRYHRTNGNLSLLLEAGSLWNGLSWIEQPLPYGAIPRLVMVHISSEAVRTQSRVIDVGDSMRQFLMHLGLQATGGARGGYTALRKQMQALAACRMTLGMTDGAKASTIDAKPIKRFDAWIFNGHHDGSQRTLWPGELELSEDFYDTLTRHAVPLDYRALGALKHSALALDIYTWLAHRLPRVNNPLGTKVSWSNLKDQFGQDYGRSKDFKKSFRHALRQVCAVYADARLRDAPGGLILLPSRSPIPRTQISLALTSQQKA